MKNCRMHMRHAVYVCVLALVGLCVATAAAGAAAPQWKLIGVTGPTNLPTEQSEIQRIAVGEADGGSFALGLPTAEGEGTLSYGTGFFSFTEGSNEVTTPLGSEGDLEAGMAIVSESVERVPPGTVIESIEGEGASTVLTLSATASSSGYSLTNVAGKEVKEVTTSEGEFRPGDSIEGNGIPAGTTVTAVGAETLTLSEFVESGGTVALSASESTEPIPYAAGTGQLDAALEDLPALGPGSVSVVGGPGGDADTPYFVTFGGPLENQNVGQLVGDPSGLEGDHAYANVFTMVPGGAGTGEIAMAPANVGGADTLGPVTAEIGPLPPGILVSGEATAENWECPSAIGTSTLVCTSVKGVGSLEAADSIRFSVEITSSASTGTTYVPMTISGGEAGADTYQLQVTVSNEEAEFGTQAFWAGQFDENGELETQAGAHPYSAATYFELNTIRNAKGQVVPAADSKEVYVDLSPGFVGNPMVTERCPQSALVPSPSNVPESTCGDEMYVGKFLPVLKQLGATNTGFIFPIYNDVPSYGYAAEFTTLLAFPAQSLLASVRSEDDYGVRIYAPNNPNYYKIFGSYAALEGYPPGAHGTPFLTNATDCANEAARPPKVVTKAATWSDPDEFVGKDVTLPPVTGCDKLEFHPDFSFQPTGTKGSSPIGADAHLHIPQDGLTDAKELATPHLKKAVVKLPEGLTLNPSSANGLEACSEDEIGYRGSDFEMPNPIRFESGSPDCPDASKLGTVEVETPLLEDTLKGTIYLAAQEENPFDSLLAIYLAIDDARTGITMKLPGKIDVDSDDGQLTATFDYNPQLPFSDLKLHFRGGGSHSELASPEVCGKYSTSGSWTPWSAPESGPAAKTSDSFAVSSGCASSPGSRPFEPTFEAGSANPVAGAYSPLVIKLGRDDGEQELRRLDFTLPAGLSGKLAGIPYCSDHDIAEARDRSGSEEQDSASCPSESQLGSVNAGAGVGSDPIHVGGKVYLAGPYKGAPISAVAIAPAVAGPFDLGNVVVRSPLYVNPATAQITAKTDDVPTSLRGIPVKLKSLAIKIDRSQFSINPTSCEAKSITATVESSDGHSASPDNRFQVGGCRALGFKPDVRLRLFGKARRGAYQGVRAVVRLRRGDSNVRRAMVRFPKSAFVAQEHINTVCTRVQFAAERCPKGSIYGRAIAYSPLVDYPLRGNVYLRSSNHTLPDVVADLRGPSWQPIRIELDGRIDSVGGALRTSFASVPDAPVSYFRLQMFGGRKGLIVNSRNLCFKSRRNTAVANLLGQNGRAHRFRTRVVSAFCAKRRLASRKQARRAKRLASLRKVRAAGARRAHRAR